MFFLSPIAVMLILLWPTSKKRGKTMNYDLLSALNAIYALPRVDREKRQEDLDKWIVEHQTEFNAIKERLANTIEEQLAKVKEAAEKKIEHKLTRQYYEYAMQFVNKHFDFATDPFSYITGENNNLAIAGFLLFRLLHNDKWTTLLDDVMGVDDATDVPYLMSLHLLSIDHLDPDLCKILRRWIPTLKIDPKEEDEEEQLAEFNSVVSEIVINSIFNMHYMRLFSSIKPMLCRISTVINQVIIKKETETSLIIGFNNNLKMAEIKRPAFYDPALKILSVLNMIKDKDIFKNFDKNGFFRAMKYDVAYLKAREINVEAVGKKLHEITNNKTFIMWNQFPASIFAILDENKEARAALYKKYADMNVIRSIAGLADTRYILLSPTIDAKQKMAVVLHMKKLLEFFNIIANESSNKTIAAILDNEDILADIRLSLRCALDCKLHSQPWYEDIISAIERIDKKGNFWIKLWSPGFLRGLKNAKSVDRENILSRSSYLKRLYTEALAAESKAKPVISEEMQEKIDNSWLCRR